MKSGEVLLAFQHVRLHEPPRGGGSSYRMSTALTPELLDASVRLLKSVDYTGVAMVEFKVDPKTGRWALMEVNGRFWGSCRWRSPPEPTSRWLSSRCSLRAAPRFPGIIASAFAAGIGKPTRVAHRQPPCRPKGPDADNPPHRGGHGRDRQERGSAA